MMKTFRSEHTFLNRKIAAISTDGNSKCLGPISIYYKELQPFLLAYIIDSEKSEYYFRIFRGPDNCEITRDMMLYPNYNDRTFRCLYDSFEIGLDSSVSHYDKNDWYDDLKITLNEYLEDKH